MNEEKTWQERVALAEHYIATGQTDHYLFRPALDGMPWEYVTSVGPGGSHRLDIQVELEIRAEHPCGLTFRWWVPLESRDADGRASYAIDTENVLYVLEHIPARSRSSLRAHLRNVADAVLKHAAEQQGYVDTQRLAGEALHALSATEVVA